jgi:hypothetical protein
MPTIDEVLRTKQASVWSWLWQPLLGETDERWVQKSLVKPQGVHLVRVRDTPVVLSHNEQTSGDHGNACVQAGLTSQ